MNDVIKYDERFEQLSTLEKLFLLGKSDVSLRNKYVDNPVFYKESGYDNLYFGNIVPTNSSVSDVMYSVLSDIQLDENEEHRFQEHAEGDSTGIILLAKKIFYLLKVTSAMEKSGEKLGYVHERIHSDLSRAILLLEEKIDRDKNKYKDDFKKKFSQFSETGGTFCDVLVPILKDPNCPKMFTDFVSETMGKDFKELEFQGKKIGSPIATAPIDLKEAKNFYEKNKENIKKDGISVSETNFKKHMIYARKNLLDNKSLGSARNMANYENGKRIYSNFSFYLGGTLSEVTKAFKEKTEQLNNTIASSNKISEIDKEVVKAITSLIEKNKEELKQSNGNKNKIAEINNTIRELEAEKKKKIASNGKLTKEIKKLKDSVESYGKKLNDFKSVIFTYLQSADRIKDKYVGKQIEMQKAIKKEAQSFIKKADSFAKDNDIQQESKSFVKKVNQSLVESNKAMQK